MYFARNVVIDHYHPPMTRPDARTAPIAHAAQRLRVAASFNHALQRTRPAATLCGHSVAFPLWAGPLSLCVRRCYRHFMRRTILALALSASCALAEQFPIEGGDRGDKRVVVSYDPKTEFLGDSGADLLLLDRDGKTIAKFPPLNADWSWTGQHPERTVYSIHWTENGRLMFVRYRAGRILSGFSVFRVGEDSVTEIDVGGTVGALYEKGRIGDPPRSRTIPAFIPSLGLPPRPFYATHRRRMTSSSLP